MNIETCRLCACNPTLEAFRCYLSTDAARFDQSLFFCVCPKMLPLLLFCQYRWYRNKVVYIHGLLPVLFIRLHIENNGPEMVSHAWGAVLLHEVTTKLFPVRLMSAFSVMITVEHFSPITCLLPKPHSPPPLLPLKPMVKFEGHYLVDFSIISRRRAICRYASILSLSFYWSSGGCIPPVQCNGHL